MPKYRIYGSKETVYFVDVNANDGFHAFEIASKLETHKWSEHHMDEIIDPYDVVSADLFTKS